MGTYVGILALILFAGLFKRYYIKIGRIKISLAFLLSCIVLFAFAALRALSVGADTRQYQIVFRLCSEEKWSKLYTSDVHYLWFRLSDYEIGYKIYNKLVSCISSNPQMITAANSLLQLLLIGMMISKYSEDTWLSIFLYYTFCFYQTALNLAPSSIASYFMFLLIPMIEKRKPVKFAAASAAGISFHTSAIFFVPLYFLNKIKFNFKRILIVVAAGLLVTILYSGLFDYISFIIPDRYLVYISGKHSGVTLELAVYFVQLAAIIICMLFVGIKKCRCFIEQNNIIVCIFLYETMVYMISTRLAAFTRGAFLFSPFTIIIIPKLIHAIDNRRLRKAATALMVLYGISVYFMRIYFNNVGATIPYNFFWQ